MADTNITVQISYSSEPLTHPDCELCPDAEPRAATRQLTISIDVANGAQSALYPVQGLR